MAVLVVSAPAHALTWNWAFSALNNGSAGPGNSGSGTFTTDQNTAIAYQTYTITGITGSCNDTNGSWVIGGLIADENPSQNTFEWDRTDNSSIRANRNGGTRFYCTDNSLPQ